MIRYFKVILWDEEIGRLAWDERRRTTYFMYNPDFVRRGIEVSPLAAPTGSFGALSPVWGEDSRLYQKLPAFLSDSLPDSWGNRLFELWRQQNHLSPSEITPLDKLAFIGKRGMGALEFHPEYSRERSLGRIDIKSLSDLAAKVFSQREEAVIPEDETVTMQSLLTVGTSAGGRQPKAIIAVNRQSGEVRSGQIGGLADFDYYLLKFGNSQYCSAELEMTYYELALSSGINMMPSKLYAVDGNAHFMTQRFDRVDGRKLHAQTLAAISPGTDSYEGLIAVCRSLRLPESDCVEVFRRMVFNILANNTDDHNKNFAFTMTPDGVWRLSPAYDITYIMNDGGFLPNEERCLSIRAKSRDVTLEDVLQFARDNGIRRPQPIIRRVADSLLRFRETASRCGVSESWTGRVEAAIFSHLKSWELLGGGTGEKDSFTVGGHTVEAPRLEQAYKGNYHLVATIDGRERKFVISANKAEYAVIEKAGMNNITSAQLLAMIEKYLLK